MCQMYAISDTIVSGLMTDLGLIIADFFGCTSQHTSWVLMTGVKNIMRNRQSMILIIVFLAISIGVTVTQAQPTTEQCVSIARASMSSLQFNCATGEDGTLCIGFDQVGVLMVEDVPDKVGTPTDRDISELLELTVGDTLDLLEVATVIVEKYSVNNVENIRGLVVMFIGANLPTTVDDQLIYLPLGEIDIENDVELEEALIVDEIVSFTTESELSVYDGPDADADVIGTMGVGVILQADALSLDGSRVRILYRYEKTYETSLTVFDYVGVETTAWIDLADLPEETMVELESLPKGELTTMQSIFLRNDYVGAQCYHLMDSLLYVQGLQASEFGNEFSGDQSIFYVNGAEFRLVGEATIEMLPTGKMQLIVLTGFVAVSENCSGNESVSLSPASGFPFANIEPSITNGYQLVPQGYVAVIDVINGENLGLDQEPNDSFTDGCDWTILGPANTSTLANLLPINDIPEGPFNRPPEIPEVICASGVGGIVCEFQIP